jgi:predicted transcriptional regulator of viral defense system
MVAKGWLHPLGGGQFVRAEVGEDLPEQSAPVQLLLHARMQSIAPYYLSYFSGLVEYGLTDHDNPALFVAVFGRHVRSRPLVVADRLVVMARITSERKWFGFTRERVQGKGFYFVGEPARVLLDCIERPDLSGTPQIVVRAWSRYLNQQGGSPAKIVEYAPRLGRATARRAGYLLDLLGHTDPANELRSARGTGGTAPTLFGGDTIHGHSRRWGLHLDVPESALSGWAAYEK